MAFLVGLAALYQIDGISCQAGCIIPDGWHFLSGWLHYTRWIAFLVGLALYQMDGFSFRLDNRDILKLTVTMSSKYKLFANHVCHLNINYLQTRGFLTDLF